MTQLEEDYWIEKIRKYKITILLFLVCLALSIIYYMDEPPKVIEYEQTLIVTQSYNSDVKVWKDNSYWDVNYAHSWIDNIKIGDKIRCKIKFHEGDNDFIVRKDALRYLYKVK